MMNAKNAMSEEISNDSFYISPDELKIMCNNDVNLFGSLTTDIHDMVMFLDTINAEAVDNNWLMGWMIADNICTEMKDDIILLNCIYDDVGAGNILSGFNHYIYSVKLAADSELSGLNIEWNWLCIDPSKSEDPYNIRHIHAANFITVDFNTTDVVSLLTKQIQQKTSYNNVFVSTTGIWKSVMVGLNVLNKFGMGFIRLNECSINTFNIIAYISSIASCEIIRTPWGHVYLKFNNFNDCRHETSFKYISMHFDDPQLLYPTKILYELLFNKELGRHTYTDIDWFDKLKKVIKPMEDSDSLFYQEYV